MEVLPDDGARWQAEVERFEQLEDGNPRLERLVADLALDVAMCKDVAGRSW